jgi:hypothetical protein
MRFSKDNRTSFGKFALALAIIALSYQNCSKVAVTDISSADPASNSNINGTPVDPGIISEDPRLKIEGSPDYVCSPFGSISVPSDKSGLKTELRYIDSGSSLDNAAKVAFSSLEYFNDQNPNFIKVPQTLYLSDVNVPTRRFEAGFTSSDGNLLKDNQGMTLIEFFGLKMDSVLKLGPNDAEGFYELSTISDDGTVLQVKINDQWTTLIDNDKAHSTRMGCMDHSIYLDKNTRLPMRLYYNQGPRTQIANVLLWNYRGSTSSAAPHDYCGKYSNDSFWNSADSTPSTWIKAVFSEGWKILTPDNFQLPDNEVNPCAYSQYDVNPNVTVSFISGTNEKIQIKSADSTILSMNLYQIQTDQSKILVKSLVLPENTEHSFETGNLDPQFQYQLELSMELPALKLKVLKVYRLRFEAQ